MTEREKVKHLLATKSHVNVNLGSGDAPMVGFINVDMQRLPGVDVVHNLEKFPWPFPDNSVDLIIASQLVEHIEPHGGIFIKFMDEAWRILKNKGQFMIATPYAGSIGYFQDPTHCLLWDSEVLTKDGFKRIEEVILGENILTLNLKTKETEYSKCIKVINEPYQGDILRFSNKAINIAVTPNHDLIWETRLPKSRLQKSAADSFENLTGFGRQGLATIPHWKGNSMKSNFDMIDYMELLGWIISEGCFIKKGNYKRIGIHQLKKANPENYQQILDLVEKMGIRHQDYSNKIDIVVEDKLYNFLALLGKSIDRYIPIPYKSLSIEYLFALLGTLLKGDGEKNSNGSGYVYTTISKKLASDVNEIALKCGYRSSIRLRKGKEFLSPNGKKYIRKDQYRVSINMSGENMLYPKPVREKYKGRIVCVQVEKNNTILTRYNGHIAWVGNCNPCNELTFAYFDPLDATTGGVLYQNYHPKPWHIMENSWYSNGNLEVLLEKRPDDPIYHKSTAIAINVKTKLKWY